MSGNGECHCTHVSDLIGKVNALEARERDQRRAGGAGQPDWWRPTRSGSPHGGDAPTSAGPDGPGAQGESARRRTLPLKLPGPLGGIARPDRNLFDDKLMSVEEYKFNGVKGGLMWKSRIERYFISKAPVLKEIFEWAEEEDNEVITAARFKEAVGPRLDEEQIALVNAAIWGFLSGVLSG